MAHSDSSTPLYSIAIAAQLVDLPEATLRLYERKGVLEPSRSDGGTRRYSDDDIGRLRRATVLRDEGLNIVAIGRVLALEDENTELRRISTERGT